MIRKNLEKQERDACSFKPKINEYKKDELGPAKTESSPPQNANENTGIISERATKKPKNTLVSTTESTGDRCKLLYDLSRKITKRDDKPTDIYKLEKEKQEFTFKPNIGKKEIKKEPQPSSVQTIDKAVERMKKAREERERVKKALERCSEDGGMKFTLNKGKFEGSFQQFSASKEESMRKSGEKNSKSLEGTFDKQIKSMQAPFSTEISPQPTKTLDENNSQRESEPKNTSEIQHENVKELKGSVKALSDAQSAENVSQPGVPNTNGDNKEALLFIDVNLGANQKRIVVYKGDTAPELAANFAKENGIFII